MEFGISSLSDFVSISGASFALIFLAEMGDKSQLVCMTLAAKHRAMPVLLGAVAAFAILNLLAVIFGAVVASWIPELWLGLLVAALFGFFGIQSLLQKHDVEDGESTINRGSLFVASFLMMLVAEFGDKTQLAVAGLASSYEGVPVWVGATFALLLTTLLGVIVGRRLLTRIPLNIVHKASGVLFLLLAFLALYHVLA